MVDPNPKRKPKRKKDIQLNVRIDDDIALTLFNVQWQLGKLHGLVFGQSDAIAYALRRCEDWLNETAPWTKFGSDG
jgi:hypothetical protein